MNLSIVLIVCIITTNFKLHLFRQMYLIDISIYYTKIMSYKEITLDSLCMGNKGNRILGHGNDT